MIQPSIQSARTAIDFSTARVYDLLQWTAETYNSHQFNTALIYLRHYFSGDGEAVSLLSRQTAFWSWWIGLWSARNESFRFDWDGVEGQLSAQELRQLYFTIHNPKILAAEIAPPRCVYPAGFSTIQTVMA